MRRRGNLALYTALFVAGVVIIALTVIFTVRERTESSRLRSSGVPVTAAVTDSSSGNRSSRTLAFEIRYVYEGVGHVAGVHCNPFKQCPVATGDVVRIWVDRERPEHFATEFGDTDASTSWFTNIGMLVPGLAAALVGGFLVYGTLTEVEEPKPKRRRGTARRSA